MSFLKFPGFPLYFSPSTARIRILHKRCYASLFEPKLNPKIVNNKVIVCFQVVDYRYLVYVIFFATILIPVLIIIWCYTAIYHRIILEEKSVKCLLRASERRRRMRNRRKLIKTLLMLVCIYLLCWCPLYLLNTIDFYFPNMRTSSIPTLATVVLSHVNCAINPLICKF